MIQIENDKSNRLLKIEKAGYFYITSGKIRNVRLEAEFRTSFDTIMTIL